ncbi:MAG TPA: hypothetical protein VEM95_05730 [Thermoplasmata archaeon]|nr:hypothetical protein [Thermoplasmata archaeon]
MTASATQPPTPPAFPGFGPPPGPFPMPDPHRQRTAGKLLAGAAILHLLAIPIVLILFQTLVSRQVERAVSWAEIFDALNQTGFMVVFVGGLVAQAVFAMVAGVAAFFLFRNRPNAAAPALAVGILAVIVSLLVLGGLVGIIGGLLSIAGGYQGLPRRQSYSAPPVPPPGPPPPIQPS